MTNWKRALGLSLALGSGASISSALAQQLNSQQIQMIRDTAASICNTIKEAKGQKSDVQIEGDVKAQLGGLVGKVVDLGGAGKGSLSREEFEGLSQVATAAALEGDRGCRERVFDKMFDKLSMMPPPDKKSSLPKAEKLIAAVDLGYHVQAIYNDLELAEHAAFCGTPGIPERWFAGAVPLWKMKIGKICYSQTLLVKIG